MGGTSFSVRTDEFVAALKRLHLHQKRWRKLDILIRAGAGVGEIILEFGGESRFAGMLTRTMQGEVQLVLLTFAIPASSLQAAWDGHMSKMASC